MAVHAITHISRETEAELSESLNLRPARDMIQSETKSQNIKKKKKGRVHPQQMNNQSHSPEGGKEASA